MHGRPLTPGTTLAALNDADAGAFVRALDGVFEHAPWVAAAAAAARPFADARALHGAMMSALRGAAPDRRAGFLNGHPELRADTLRAGLTPASSAEQDALALHAAAGAEALPALNRGYRERFGFPFIVCVARHTPENVLRSLRARFGRDPADEEAAALDEVGHITRLRLCGLLGLPPAAGHLGTHVLDQAAGRPAAGLAVRLLAEGRDAGGAVTDADGRAGPLLPPGPLREGRYELIFDAGAYFAFRHTPTFYDTIPVRFAIDHAEGRFHVPLLLSPFGYGTYRGS